MKKGISLIVLVITIIVMIVIAGAIILALNSSNVTNKAKWAQISADRANLQSEYATILANALASEKIGSDEDSANKYDGLTFTDVKAFIPQGETTAAYEVWKKKVDDTNSYFDIEEPADVNPAGLKITLDVSKAEADAYGLTLKATTTGEGDAAVTTYTVVGYDWVEVTE